MWLLLLFIALLFLYLIAGIEVVKENTVYVVEFFGKFSRILTAGLNFRLPLMEEVVEQVTLKQQNFEDVGRYHTKDNGVIDVSTNIIFQVIPTVDGVRKYMYSLVEREKTFATTIEHSFRTSFARESYEDALEKREALTKEVWKDLDRQFQQWGIKIISVQIMGLRQVQTF